MNSFAIWIIRGLVPWFIFLAFIDGTFAGLLMASAGGFIALLFLNHKFLGRFSPFDWMSLCFYAVVWFIDLKWQYLILERYIHIGAYLALSLFCFFSLAIGKPFSAIYATGSPVRIINDHSPFFITVNWWITFFWGVVTLLASAAVGFFEVGIGSRLWMKDIIPAAMIIAGVIFTIFFPDRYRARFSLPGTVLAQKLISPVRVVVVGGIRMAYRTLGSGRLLVLFQGGGLTMHHWDGEFIKALARDYEVLIFDYPGVGYSTYKEMSDTVDTIASYVYEMLAVLTKKPFALIGYSMGGWIAQEFAIKYNTTPYAPTALVLIATDCGKASILCTEEVKRARSNWQEKNISGVELAEKRLPFYFPATVSNLVRDRFFACHQVAEWEKDITKENFIRLKHLASNWYDKEDSGSNAKKLLLPVLIISGAIDSIIPMENSDQLAKYYPHATKIIYQNAGHGIVYHYPLELAKAIEQFLNSL